MKLNYKLTSLLLLLFFVACDKDFEEINTDGNNPSVVQPAWLLTAAQKSLSEYTWNEWANSRFGMVYSQYWAANVYTDESRYKLRDGVNNSYWGYYYTAVISNLNEVIRLCNDDEATLASFTQAERDNYVGTAMTLKVWMFQMITDIYGMVPYTQSGGGVENPYPAYDDQATIYAGLLSELAAAYSKLNGATISGDLIYGGNGSSWKKFNASLQLRVGMRIADRDEASAKAAVADALSKGVFTSSADNALFSFTSSAPNNNPQNEDRKTRSDFAVSNVLVDLMMGMEDPRLPAFADKASASDTYVGLTYGLDQEAATAIANIEVSQPSGSADLARGVFAADAPMILMEAGEVEFLLAEASERGFGNAGTAEEHYNAAINNSMSFWGVETGGYLDRSDVAYGTAAGTWKEKIGRQKYLALYMQGIQAWIEWRRLDFGILVMPAAGVLVGDGIPNRRSYPSDEQTLNEASYMDAVNTQGTDNLATKVWWDVN